MAVPTAHAADTKEESLDSLIERTVLPLTDIFADAIFASFEITTHTETRTFTVPAHETEPFVFDVMGLIGGQEPPHVVTISGLPADVTLSKGEDLGDGFWRLTGEQVKGLTVSAASAPLALTLEAAYGADLPVILIWLLSAALILTLYMGFINFRGFKQAIRIVRGDYQNPDHKGEVSHFQALTAALSGTVGLGNIAGVAIAISVGGPGATVWMILAGLLGMSSKFVECTLGVKYRNINKHGVVSGGPMYYLTKGFANRGLPRFGKFLGVFAALMCMMGALGAGGMFQTNQAFEQLETVTGGSASLFHDRGWMFGAVISILVGAVIIGGIKSIARVTDKLVPIMCGIYVLAALVVLFSHFGDIPDAAAIILKGAFSPEAVGGGFIGVLIQGFRRATFSNEAGIGSAAIAHAAVRTNEPITEGLVSLLEPFIDTVVVCTMTALVIVITGAYQADTDGIGGVTLTSNAFASVISWFPYILAIAVVLFAFSTTITWSYYGSRSWAYLTGDSKALDIAFKAMICIAIVVGPTIDISRLVDFSDATIFAMAFPNILGLYIMAPEVKRDLASYMARIRSGEIKSYRVQRIAEA